MRLHYAVSIMAIGLMALAMSADDAAATNNCGNGTGATGNWCQGWSHIRVTSALGGAACFSLRTETFTGACATTTGANLATWQMDAGACLTLYYYRFTSGTSPPVVPNKVTIEVRFDNTATVVKNFQSNAAQPANGATFTFCATSDGNSGSAARAGTYRLYLRVIKDDSLGGVDNYDWNSDGTGSGLTLSGYDTGAVRGRVVVSSLSASAPAAGSTYAYGPSGDESITVSATHTQPNGDNNVETLFNYIADEATLAIGQAGATVDTDSTSLAQGFTVDLTFPQGNNPYVAGQTLVGNSLRFAIRWTVYAPTGHAAGLVRYSDTSIYNPADLTIDPRIVWDSDGAGTFATADDQWLNKAASCSGTVTTDLNRGEVTCIEGYGFNARNEQLTRTLTFSVEDASANVCQSGAALTPTAGKYSSTFTTATGGTCAAAATNPGSPRYLRGTGTDQNHLGVQDFTVSSLYYVDAHSEIALPLTTDDFPTEDATEDFAYYIRSAPGGGDASDTFHGWCHVKNVRQDTNIDTSGSAVTGTLRDPTPTSRASAVGDTGSDGWTGTSVNLLTTTPLGDWTWTCDVAFNGNTGTDVEDVAFGVEGGGGETIYTGADPLTIFCLHDATSGLVHCTISSRFLNGSARLDAEDEIFVDFYDATHALVEDDYAVLEQSDGDGAYYATWTPPADGLYEAVAHTLDPVSGDPIGAHNVVEVQSQELFAMSFNTLEFDGFLFLLFWGSILLYALARSRVFAGFAATLGLLETVMASIMPGSFLGYFFLLVIAVWLEAVAGDRIYTKWLGKKQGDTDPE